MQAIKELWEHVLFLSKTDKESFEGGLTAWHVKWGSFLNERKVDLNGKNRVCSQEAKKCLQNPQNKLTLVVYLV
jgi:hypothetical protein